MRWLEKQRYIIDFTLASLLRRKMKSLALISVYTIVIFLLASVVFFTHAIKREASLVLANAPEMVVQRLVAGRHDLIPLSYMEEIKKIKGVYAVKGRLWGYYYDPTNGANYTLMVAPEMNDTTGEIVIGKGVARNLPGENYGAIPLKASDGSYLFLRVRDIIPAESELVSADLILMSETDFRRMFGIPPEYVTDITLEVRNPKEYTTVATKISQILPDSRPILREEILRTYEAVFDWRGGILVVIFLGSVLAFLILAWDRSAGLSAEERHETGILKAVGWETSDVLQMKFWEGFTISLTSFLAGIVMAYVHVFIFGSSLFDPVLKGWSVLYPEFELVPFIDGLQVATLFFLTVVPFTVATIIPAWRTATIDPDLMMRS